MPRQKDCQKETIEYDASFLQRWQAQGGWAHRSVAWERPFSWSKESRCPISG